MYLEDSQAFLSLVRLGIGHTVDSLTELFDWKEIMAIAEMQGLSAVLVNGIEKLPQEKRPPQSVMLEIIGMGLMIEQKSKLQWDAVQSLVELYTQNGITTVGLKGITVAQWLPNPMLRDSCDFDCFLLKNGSDGKVGFAYEEGNKVVEAKGAQVDRNIYVHSIFEYKGLTVENHQYLSAVKLSKRHRKMDAFLRKLLVEEPLLPVMDSKLMMGSTMFNAVFLTHHAHRHFLNEYLPIKLLIDWALFVKNNSTLNWQLYQEYVDEFGMLRFAQSMTRLAGKLLGVSVPFELLEDAEADELLESSLWDFPETSSGKRTMFTRHLGIIRKLMHSRKKYQVFYDSSSFAMIAAYIKGYFLGKEE